MTGLTQLWDCMMADAWEGSVQCREKISYFQPREVFLPISLRNKISVLGYQSTRGNGNFYLMQT